MLKMRQEDLLQTSFCLLKALYEVEVRSLVSMYFESRQLGIQ